MVVSRFFCLAVALVQAGIIYRSLGVEGTGRFGFSLAYASLFSVFATLGVQRLLVRDIARDPSRAWACVWSAVALVAVLSVIVMGVIAASIVVIEPSSATRLAVVLAAASVVVLWALQRPFEALLIARERMGWIALVNIVAAVLKLGSVWIFVQTAPSAAMAHGAIAGANLVGFGLCVASAVYVAGWEWPRVDVGEALQQVRECFPFAVAMLCSLVYFKSDLALLKFLGGDEAAGLYTPVQRVMEPLLMVAGLWGTAVFPALCRVSVESEKNYDRLRKSSTRLALLVSIPMAFGIIVLADPVMQLMTGARMGEFGPSVRVLSIASLMLPFFYLNGMGQEFLYAAHRNWCVVRIYGVAAVSSVVLNLAVIPYFGVVGVAWVAVRVNGLVSLLLVYEMRSMYGAMGLGALIGKSCVACGVMAGAAYWLAPFSLVVAVVVGIGVYGVLQMLLRTLNEDERRLVRRLVATVLGGWR